MKRWRSLLREARYRVSRTALFMRNRPRRGRQPLYPTVIQVQTFNRCNGACIMCPYHATVAAQPEAWMPENLFFRIVDEVASWPQKGIFVLTFQNEPLLDNRNKDDPRWLSYLLAVAQTPTGEPLAMPLRAGPLERGYLALSRALAGRYPMHRRQSGPQLALQLAGNGLLGGTFRAKLRFLTQARRSGAALRSKRLLFQMPAEVSSDGTVVHCRNCPDAVALGGRLVPVCIADKVSEKACRWRWPTLWRKRWRGTTTMRMPGGWGSWSRQA